MVYIQQAMNSLLERHKRQPHYPRIQVIPVREDILDNLPDLEFQI